jgi:hypothetical protein
VLLFVCCCLCAAVCVLLFCFDGMSSPLQRILLRKMDLDCCG